MDTSPLEAAVRNHFRTRCEALASRNPRFSEDALEGLVERSTDELLPILRERLSDHDFPTEEDLHQAEMERSERSIQNSIILMNAPGTLARLAKNPRKLGIVLALAKNAVIDLAALRTLRHNPTEEQLEQVAQGITKRMIALTEKVKTSDAGGPPTPQ